MSKYQYRFDAPLSARELTVDEMDLVSGGVITQRLPDGGYGRNGAQSGQWSPYSDMAYSVWLLTFGKNI
jgi:hypothetical protein